MALNTSSKIIGAHDYKFYKLTDLVNKDSLDFAINETLQTIGRVKYQREHLTALWKYSEDYVMVLQPITDETKYLELEILDNGLNEVPEDGTYVHVFGEVKKREASTQWEEERCYLQLDVQLSLDLQYKLQAQTLEDILICRNSG